jgi:phosphatidylglycerophosphatase C
MRGHQAPVVVFDLDDTLCRGDSFGLFLRVLLLRSRLRAAVSMLVGVVLVPFFFVPPLRRSVISAFVWLATVGVPLASFDALVVDFAARHTVRSRRIGVALARLREHRERGDRIVIATGCADPVASAVCRALGLDEQVVAAQLRRGRAAYLAANECRGVWKVRRLREAGIEFPVAWAYSDSSLDIPLLRAATNRVLIDPSPRTVRRVRAALGDGFTILRSGTPDRLPRAGEWARMEAMVELVQSNDPVLISFVTSLLTDAGIEHNVADSHMSVIDGSIGAIARRIMVAPQRLDEARRLLAEAGVAVESD